MQSVIYSAEDSSAQASPHLLSFQTQYTSHNKKTDYWMCIVRVKQIILCIQKALIDFLLTNPGAADAEQAIFSRRSLTVSTNST